MSKKCNRKAPRIHDDAPQEGDDAIRRRRRDRRYGQGFSPGALTRERCHNDAPKRDTTATGNAVVDAGALSFHPETLSRQSTTVQVRRHQNRPLHHDLNETTAEAMPPPGSPLPRSSRPTQPRRNTTTTTATPLAEEPTAQSAFEGRLPGVPDLAAPNPAKPPVTVHRGNEMKGAPFRPWTTPCSSSCSFRLPRPQPWS